jgi:hypothetical protein
MRIKSLEHLVDGLTKLNEAIFNITDLNEKNKLILINSINVESVMNMFLFNKLEPSIEHQNIDEFIEVKFKRYKNDRNSKIEQYESINGIMTHYNDLCTGFYITDVDFYKVYTSIDTLGEEYSFLYVLMFNSLEYFRKKEDFVNIFKKITDELIDNFDLINLNNKRKHISYREQIMFLNNEDFKYINKISTNFSQVKILTLNNNKNLKEEFIIAKDFYLRAIDVMKKEFIKIRESDKEAYDWFSDYWLDKYIQKIKKASLAQFAFDKLEPKLLKTNLKIKEDDKNYILSELYELLDKNEVKLKSCLNYNILPEYNIVENELNLINHIMLSDKRGFATSIMQNRTINYLDYDLTLKKIDKDIFVLKLKDKTQEQFILKNEYEINEIVSEALKSLVFNIKERRKNIFSQRDFKSFVNDELKTFFDIVDRNIRAKKLLTITNNQDDVKVKKKI